MGKIKIFCDPAPESRSRIWEILLETGNVFFKRSKKK